MALVLASKSPRRQELMHFVAHCFEIDVSGFDESKVTETCPSKLAIVLAEEKAKEVFARRPRDIVIGCDTVVEVNGSSLGKPKNTMQATEMLNALQNKAHKVHTGVSICTPGQKEPVCSFIETTTVYFGAISKEEISEYVKTKEAYDKAGGYGVQGWAARYIYRIEGCYYNVMGLPVASLYHHLSEIEAYN